MLNYKVLNLKKKFVNSNNELQLDLLTKTIDDVSARPSNMIIVNKDYVARPDLISLAVYGSDEYADFICKYNGISNPFEMNENDIIFIPDINTFANMIADNITASELCSDKSKIQEKQHKYQVEKEETRSPSRQLVGETNYVIDKSLGVIYF